MTYSIGQLAELSGISTRTLRYYEALGILLPSRKNDSGYRFYGEKEADILQQILFYKERGFELKQIKELLIQENLDIMTRLEDHLLDLKAKKARLEAMIDNLEHTIQAQKGKSTMTAQEKFQAFKEKQIAENDAKYGTELRNTYGEEEIHKANQHFAQMNEETYKQWQKLDQDIKTLLHQAIVEGWTVEDERSKEIVQLHKKWLQIADKNYLVEKHIGIAQLYTADERFTTYYDDTTKGCAAFLTASISHWAKLID
ncbi:MerR family transcriptional regulator [Streptococcus thoraltensis]|uniref:MerR family transcriptional regulator n=1 Tax=Streptococcus thoraltensis TaxID=55085 RepID=UPI00035F4EFE|nr:MerR family transcriptional regulator [Streptococcus thoraltensis]MDY4761472.1 MerR family transcriptional regulator [Streptococcus thoraltensis]